MIDIRKLKELVRLMVDNDLAELDLRDQQETVTIKRGATGHFIAAPAAPGGVPAVISPDPAPGLADNGHAADADEPTPADLLPIASPMVGTFYAASSPDAEPFLSVGSRVSQGAVVCILEAMKVFNEIKSDVSGVVERVLVKNGEAVEFGQPMFLVRPG